MPWGAFSLHKTKGFTRSAQGELFVGQIISPVRFWHCFDYTDTNNSVRTSVWTKKANTLTWIFLLFQKEVETKFQIKIKRKKAPTNSKSEMSKVKQVVYSLKIWWCRKRKFYLERIPEWEHTLPYMFPRQQVCKLFILTVEKISSFYWSKKELCYRRISSSFTTTDRQKREYRNKWGKPFTE